MDVECGLTPCNILVVSLLLPLFFLNFSSGCQYTSTSDFQADGNMLPRQQMERQGGNPSREAQGVASSFQCYCECECPLPSCNSLSVFGGRQCKQLGFFWEKSFYYQIVPIQPSYLW